MSATSVQFKKDFNAAFTKLAQAQTNRTDGRGEVIEAITLLGSICQDLLTRLEALEGRNVPRIKGVYEK